MANMMSRRVFLKCAGVAALAVTASGIFSGCSEEPGTPSEKPHGVNDPIETNGVNVKLLGYQQGLFSQIAGNYADKTLIAICFGLNNQSEQSIQMGNTTQDELTKVWAAIKNNDFSGLSKSEFTVVTQNQRIGHAAIGYKTTEAGIGGILDAGFMGTLEPKKTGCVKVFAVVPSDWEQIGIQYTPFFAPSENYNFVLNRTNKL